MQDSKFKKSIYYFLIAIGLKSIEVGAKGWMYYNFSKDIDRLLYYGIADKSSSDIKIIFPFLILIIGGVFFIIEGIGGLKKYEWAPKLFIMVTPIYIILFFLFVQFKWYYLIAVIIYLGISYYFKKITDTNFNLKK